SFRCDAPATAQAYTLSLHDALPICRQNESFISGVRKPGRKASDGKADFYDDRDLGAMDLAAGNAGRYRRQTSWRGLCDIAGCGRDRESTRLNSSHVKISYAVFCLKK